jgi:WD40 repeat protein
VTGSKQLVVVSQTPALAPDDSSEELASSALLVTNPPDPELDGELTPASYGIERVARSPDGVTVAVAIRRNRTRLRGATDDRIGPRGRLVLLRPGNGHFVAALLDDIDGREIGGLDVGATLVAAGHEEVLHVWDSATGAPEWRDGADAFVDSVAVAPNQAAVAAGRGDGTVGLSTGAGAIRAWQAHDGPVRAVAWRADGGAIASGGDDAMVRVWDAESLELLGEAEVPDEVDALRFDGDGHLLVNCSQPPVVVELALG